MIVTFKTFNTKTKEVKEYSKPNFGDFGDYILINADSIDISALRISNTALFSDNNERGEGLLHMRELAISFAATYDKNKFHKHTSHELNTLHNGLFKDCIYTSGDWVGVLQKSFKYSGKIYKVGDVYDVERIRLDNKSVRHKYTKEYTIDLACNDSGYEFYGISNDDTFSAYRGQGVSMPMIQGRTQFSRFSLYSYRRNVIDEYFTK